MSIVIVDIAQNFLREILLLHEILLTHQILFINCKFPEKRVEAKDIEQLAYLARLEITQETMAETAKSITEVLALVDQLQNANTDNITPMAHPLDAVQTLRADVVTEPDAREKLQAMAPAVEDGLYLVPHVLSSSAN